MPEEHIIWFQNPASPPIFFVGFFFLSIEIYSEGKLETKSILEQY
jgi:hypothetical protein